MKATYRRGSDDHREGKRPLVTAGSRMWQKTRGKEEDGRNESFSMWSSILALFQDRRKQLERTKLHICFIEAICTKGMLFVDVRA